MMAAFMDELVIDPLSGEQLTERHAIFIPIVDNRNELLEYLKAVGNVIGSANIRSAYRVGDRIKVYMKFGKYVEELVTNGIRLEGTLTSVDYCVPPATEVLLKEVDTEIPNQILVQSLELYGKVLSKITTLRLSSADAEFCHIETNVRKVFVDFRKEVIIPSVMKVVHGLKEYTILVEIQDSTSSSDYATLETEPEKQQSPRKTRRQDIDYRDSTRYKMKSSPVKLATSRSSEKSFKKSVYMKNVSEIITKKSTKSFRKDHQPDNQLVQYDPACQVIYHNTSENIISLTQEQESPSSVFEDFVIPPSGTKRITSQTSVSEFPFTLSKLQEFLRRVKNNRSPLDIALTMLEENGTSNCIDELCDQLIQYFHYCKDASVRFRISRLLEKMSSPKKALT